MYCLLFCTDRPQQMALCENLPVYENDSYSNDDRCVMLLHLTVVINICELS